MHSRQYYYVWEFALKPEDPDAPLIQVEMRGPRFDGVLVEGDEVEVTKNPQPGKILHTRRIYNLTANAPFEVRGFGQAPVKLQYAGTGLKAILLIVFLVVFVTILIVILHAASSFP
jgi:hypothetical protein